MEPRSVREEPSTPHRHYHYRPLGVPSGHPKGHLTEAHPYLPPPYTSPAPHNHTSHQTSTTSPTSTPSSHSSSLRTHNGYLYPLRPLGNYSHYNNCHPVPIAPLHRPNSGDQTSISGRSEKSEYVPSLNVQSPTVTSAYYPHTNLRPLSTPVQGYGNSSHHYSNYSPAEPLSHGRSPRQASHHVLQPIRPYNGQVRGSSTAQPIVPRNAYARPPVASHSVPVPYGDQENQPPPQELSPQSDKQLLRNRLASRGVYLDQTTRIGSGRYSKVMTAKVKDGGTIAIKVINISKVTHEFRTKFLPREIECWERLKHNNLVKLLSRDEIAGRVFLFMEYGRGGDLLTHVQKNGPVPEDTASLWMRQVVAGLAYMHKQGVVHRDLKLENVIIFSQTSVKITDFGFARAVIDSDLSTTYCGSKSYSAPEILSGRPYNPYKADVWSLGVIAYVVVTDRMPFKDSMPNSEIITAQRNRLYAYPPQLNLSAAFRAAIDALLVFDAQARPDVNDVGRLMWFQKAEARPRLQPA